MNSVLKQQQRYQSRLQIRPLCELLEKRIALKRWEFQHTAFDPPELWKIANEVEALNWVLKKVQVLSGIENTSEGGLDRIVVLLKKELLKIEKYLCKPINAEFKFSKKNHAQRNLKHLHRRRVLFTAKDLIHQGIYIKK